MPEPAPSPAPDPAHRPAGADAPTSPGPSLALPPVFHVVLHEPEIPNNTGNIGRTCIACACALHLVHPLGFSTSEKACRRAGLDYWPRLGVVEHGSWASYERAHEGARRWYFDPRGRTTLWNATFQPGDHLVFGKETRGLPAGLLDAHADRVVSLPMAPRERSLNLATVVCAVLYEGLRQMESRGLVRLRPDGRLDLPGHG